MDPPFERMLVALSFALAGVLYVSFFVLFAYAVYAIQSRLDRRQSTLRPSLVVALILSPRRETSLGGDPRVVPRHLLARSWRLGTSWVETRQASSSEAGNRRRDEPTVPSTPRGPCLN